MIEQLIFLPEYLFSHLSLTLTSLLVGVLISVPLGVIASRFRFIERISLGITGVIQTVPSLAFLAGMVPFLALLGAPSIGYLPACIALSMYSVLPMLRNTVVGLRAVEPAFIEAAKGVGMTSLQRLLKVELPLATPMIIAGIRTSTIWTVGTATLSTAVGATSLGNYIFIGLQTRNNYAILIGCISAAGLALVLDGLIRILALSIERNARFLTFTICSVFALFYITIGLNEIAEYLKTTPRPVVVGAKAFTEQYILSEIIAQKIEKETNSPVKVRQSLGSLTAFDALCASDIDIYVEYTGTIWTHIMHKNSPPKNKEVLYQKVLNFLAQYQVNAIGQVGFNNVYVLAIKRELSEKLDIKRISDLSKYKNFVLGGDYEFFGRPEWISMRKAYDLTFSRKIPLDHALMYQAINDNKVDVIISFSTDGHIAANDLIILEDDKKANLSYYAIILASPMLAKNRPDVVKALYPLIGAIDEARMQRLNALVDAVGKNPAVVARQFISGANF
jgi:osmoprotectant transport system permease protein